MDNQLTDLDQYKMLREELMQHFREVYRTEISGAIAVGAVYTWLLLHKQGITPRAIWFIPPLVIFVCAIRCLALAISIKVIAGYLRRIEEAAFGQDDILPGWERYISERGRRRLLLSFYVFAAVAWGLMFAGSIIASWLLSR